MIRAIVIALFAASTLLAQSTPSDSVLDARTRALASELRCPVCQGESIEASPSELAVELKAVVREQLASGKSEDEVRAYFVARYGEWILLQPKAKGFNLAVYLVPPLVLLGGAAIVVLLVRRWTRARRSDGEPELASSEVV